MSHLSHLGNNFMTNYKQQNSEESTNYNNYFLIHLTRNNTEFRKTKKLMHHFSQRN